MFVSEVGHHLEVFVRYTPYNLSDTEWREEASQRRRWSFKLIVWNRCLFRCVVYGNVQYLFMKRLVSFLQSKQPRVKVVTGFVELDEELQKVNLESSIESRLYYVERLRIVVELSQVEVVCFV